MAVGTKKLRYYYWLMLEFVKKHNKLIFLSFLTSVIFVVSVITISPYISSSLVRKKRVIGIIGSYEAQSFQNLPDEILSKISSGLTVVNDTGAVLPMLASTWEKSKDEKTYTFTIKKNLLLNNGTLFSAKHISLSFRDVTMKVINDYTVQFTLTKPLSIFPLYLTKPIIVYPYTGVAGLYSVDRVKQKSEFIQEIVLSPNRKDVQPITYVFYPNEGDMITAYKLGKINEMTITNKTLADAFGNWKNTTVTKSVDYTRLLTLFYNEANQIVKEKDFRSAVESTFNYDSFSSYGQLATSSIPPTSWAYNPDLKKRETDTDYAKKMFKHYVATSSAKMTLVTYYDYLDIADVVSSDLRDAGLPVTVNVASYSTSQQNFDFMLAYLKVPTDPDQYYYWHSTQSLAQLLSYRNLKVDKLLEDGRSTFKVNDRKTAYFDMQKTMSDDPPGLFLFYPYIYQVKRK